MLLIITPTRVWMPFLSPCCRAVDIPVPLIVIWVWNVSQRLVFWRLDPQCSGSEVGLPGDTCVMKFSFINGRIPFSDGILGGGETLEVRRHWNEWSPGQELCGDTACHLAFSLPSYHHSRLPQVAAAPCHTFAFCSILPHHRSIAVGSKWLNPSSDISAVISFPPRHVSMGYLKIGKVSQETPSCEVGWDSAQALWSPVDSTPEHPTNLLMEPQGSHRPTQSQHLHERNLEYFLLRNLLHIYKIYDFKEIFLVQSSF